MRKIKVMRKLFILLALLFPTIIYSQSLSGTYTIGKDDCDFTTISAAVTSLVDNGVDGATKLVITSSYNSAEESIPIVINSISGTSAENAITITLADDADVNISGNAQYILHLKNTSFFTISGDNRLTFTNENTDDYSAVILIGGDINGLTAYPHDITIEDCNIVGGSNKTETYGIVSASCNFPNIQETMNIDISLIGNDISNVSTGIYVDYLWWAEYTNSSYFIIKNNNIGSNDNGKRVSKRGIWFENFIDSLVIQGNTIFNLLDTTEQVIGIKVKGFRRYADISGNLVLDVANHDLAGTAAGIYIDKSDLFNTSLENCKLLCYNNMVSHVAGNTANGIFIQSAYNNPIENYQIYHNSVYLIKDFLSEAFINCNSSCLSFSSEEGTIVMQNNIFRNDFGDMPGEDDNENCCAINFDGTNFEDINFTTTNNILYYSSLSAASAVSQMNGENPRRYSFDEWTEYINDTTNLNKNPGFISPTMLMIEEENSAGIPIAGIHKDFFGNVRSYETPDIGAHEKRDNSGFVNYNTITFNAYYQNGRIKVYSDENMKGNIYVMNTNGQVIAYTKVNGKTAEINMSHKAMSGIYVVYYKGVKSGYTKIAIF